MQLNAITLRRFQAESLTKIIRMNSGTTSILGLKAHGSNTIWGRHQLIYMTNKASCAAQKLRSTTLLFQELPDGRTRGRHIGEKDRRHAEDNLQFTDPYGLHVCRKQRYLEFISTHKVPTASLKDVEKVTSPEKKDGRYYAGFNFFNQSD